MMEGITHLDEESGRTSRTERFKVHGKPGLLIKSGARKGDVLIPEVIEIQYHWGGGGGRVPAWAAFLQDGGYSVLPFSWWEAPLADRPDWLVALVKEYGPPGWHYRDNRPT